MLVLLQNACSLNIFISFSLFLSTCYKTSDYYKIVNDQVETMDEMEIMLSTLGDEPITLMDQYERLSFEVQLNRAMLGRSLSETSARKTRTWLKPKPKIVNLPVQPVAFQAHQGPKEKRPHGLGFRKVFEKLLKPIFVRVRGRKEAPDAKEALKTWKAFSKSMRV